MPEQPPIDPEVIARVQLALEHGRRKRFVAVAIDVSDLETLLSHALGEDHGPTG